MSDEVDYEVVCSAGDLGDPPALKSKLVVLPEWRRKNGKATAFYQHELNTGEHDDFELSDKVFDKLGNITRYKRTGRDFRWLARTTRDGNGNRIWHTDEECEAALKPLGKSITNKMVAAANEVNYGDPATGSADDAVSDAEKNSETNPS